MTVFLFVLLLFAVLTLTPLRRLAPLHSAMQRAAWSVGPVFVLTGSAHFTSPDRFLTMMPPFLAEPELLVAISGAAEIAGGIGLLIPRVRKAAGLGLLVLLVAVFPANIYAAMSENTLYHWVRLPFQLVWLGWTAWAAGHWDAGARLQAFVNRQVARGYDDVMARSEADGLGDWRQALLADARGFTIDVGAGTGANLPHLPPGLDHVAFVEPDASMFAELEAAVRADGRVGLDVVQAPAESLPFPDESVDTVITTLVLCSVDDPQRALAEVRRVLKPGGQLLFIEHVGASCGTAQRATQEVVEPVWQHVAGNCHPTRDTEATLRQAGFRFQSLEHADLPATIWFSRPAIRGVAVA